MLSFVYVIYIVHYILCFAGRGPRYDNVVSMGLSISLKFPKFSLGGIFIVIFSAVFLLFTRIIQQTCAVYDWTVDDSRSVFSETILKNVNLASSTHERVYIYVYLVYNIIVHCSDTSMFIGSKARRTEQSMQVVMIVINFVCFGRVRKASKENNYYKVSTKIA